MIVCLVGAISDWHEESRVQDTTKQQSVSSSESDDLFLADRDASATPTSKLQSPALSRGIMSPTGSVMSFRAGSFRTKNTGSASSTGKGAPSSLNGLRSPLNQVLGNSTPMANKVLSRVGSQSTTFTYDTHKTPGQESSESETHSQTSVKHEPEITLFDFVKRSFLKSDFLVKPIAKPPLRRRKVFKDLHPRVPTNKTHWHDTIFNGRLKVLANKAKDHLHQTEGLKYLAKHQKNSFHCRIVKEKELKYLPEVVAAYPGRPNSILMVAPMNKKMSVHKINDFTSELRHLQTSTLCVRDMIEPYDVKEFFDMVKMTLPLALISKKNRMLTTLCLSRVNLGPESISYLIESILMNENCNLKHLFCKSNNLGDTGAIRIAKCLSQVNTTTQDRYGVARTLISLWLGQNEIHDKGAAALGNAVANHPSLEHLDLSGNRITDRGAEAMSIIVHENAILKQLNLADNQVLGYGNDAFDRAVRKDDAVADSLTVISGTKERPRVACRPRSAKSRWSGAIIKDSNLYLTDSIKEEYKHEDATQHRTRKEIDKEKLLSKRDTAVEGHISLNVQKAMKLEDRRKEMWDSTLVAHASKSQEGQMAQKLITEIGKQLVRLEHQLVNVEKVRFRFLSSN